MATYDLNASINPLVTSDVGGYLLPLSRENVGINGFIRPFITSSGNLGTEILPHKMYIGDLSMAVEEWRYTSSVGPLYVDVTANLLSHIISSTESHFELDGVPVSTTLSGIPYGYRLFYNPSPNDLVASGTITLTVHAESLDGAVIEKDFHLLYGYHAVFDEVIDWGPNKDVVIIVEAMNEVFCPNTESDAFYFQTSDLASSDLSASIAAIGSVDLGATIYPQNKFFFYGRTYTVTVSGVKDFAGNVMPAQTFTFTIEDPT